MSRTQYTYLVGFIIGFVGCCLIDRTIIDPPINKLEPSTTFQSCTIPANSQWVQENCYVEEHDGFNKWDCKDGSMLLIMK